MFGKISALFGKNSGEPQKFEQALEVLGQGGLHLAEPFQVSDLVSQWGREVLDKGGYKAALLALGSVEDEPPFRSHCVNAWHFDTECIEDHGDYCRIAERMREIAQGSLPIENLRDHVDIEEGSAWLKFDFGRDAIHIDCAVNDDWVDASLFRHFVSLLDLSDKSKIFLYYDLGGQDCIIACTTKEQFGQLKAAGVKFEPLH